MTTDPKVEYERFDPETNEPTGQKGMTRRSTVEWMIEQGEPVRIIEILTPGAAPASEGVGENE